MHNGQLQLRANLQSTLPHPYACVGLCWVTTVGRAVAKECQSRRYSVGLSMVREQSADKQRTLFRPSVSLGV